MNGMASKFGNIVGAWREARASHWKVVDGDKVVAVMPMVYTWSLVCDLSEDAYEYRYCYEHRADAIEAFMEFETLAEHPNGPWIKRKGHPAGELVGPGSRDYVAEQRVPECGGAAAVGSVAFNDSEDA